MLRSKLRTGDGAPKGLRFAVRVGRGRFLGLGDRFLFPLVKNEKKCFSLFIWFFFTFYFIFNFFTFYLIFIFNLIFYKRISLFATRFQLKSNRVAQTTQKKAHSPFWSRYRCSPHPRHWYSLFFVFIFLWISCIVWFVCLICFIWLIPIHFTL